MTSTASENNDMLDELKIVRENLRHRRTVALFEDRAVDRQHILDAIDVARWAPNHHLTQPWRFYLLGEKAREATLHWIEIIVGERTKPALGKRKAEKWAKVPGWTLVTCRNSDDELTRREDYAACACAIHSFSLYLWQLGIGMKWSTGSITRDRRYLDVLGIDPDLETVVGLIMYGYPKLIPVQKRSPVSHIVTELD